MNTHISLLIVDDHQALRKGLKDILTASLHVQNLYEADSSEQAYELFCKHIPDIVITDLSMPGLGGLELIRKILARHPAAKIIAYTMHDEYVFAVQTLAAGAMGYVLKSAEADTLISAISSVCNNKRYMSADIAQKVALRSLTGELTTMDSLTSREFEVFRLIASGYTVADIAKMMTISYKTVATYQTRLKRKLDIKNPIDLVKTAMQHGVI